ncbi:LCP family protein [Streptomyces sp. MST-110588]|uniref:LCP family protein n=1 Tax=Streptomyces sp. MST-110588 TaxID=2833628 RepID=UPI001F5C3B72|nr:LCP family protein [Streptomyces sp. MST-110588]
MTEPSPSPSDRATPRRAGRRRHRRARRPRWGLRATTCVSLLVLAAGGAGRAMLVGVEDGIERVDPFKGMSNRPHDDGDGRNFLVVGTDGRDKLTPREKRTYHLGGEPCHCTDTIMLVHLSGDRERAGVISLPRDSYAEAPEHVDQTTGERHGAHPLKINAAYAEGGPALTVRTVEHMTGVHIDHYLEVDFTSFMKTVDAVGGVRICTSRPLRDSYTGLDLPVGTTRLNGGQALQYVRSRHVDGAADIGRMRRQQRFLAALIHRITSSGVLMNPVRFKEVTSALLESVRADEGFGAGEMLALGQAMRGFTPASSEFTSVPIGDVDYEVPGVGSTVRWNQAKAAALFRSVREDRPLALHRGKGRHHRATLVDVPPHSVRVQVDNGTGRSGLGSSVDKALSATGFATTGSPGNAAVHEPRTVITYDPGWDRSVRTLAAALPGAELRPVPGQGALMRVTVGEKQGEVHRVRADDGTQAPDDFTTITGDEALCP